MVKNQLPESTVALFFTILIVPLVIFENKIGELSLKKGFRYFFKYGFVGLTIISLILFFVDKITIQLGIIIIGSFFVSFLEPIQDTYFFKQTKKFDEEKYYPIFSTSADLGSFIGKIVIAVVLLFLPNKFAYLSMFLMMGFFAVMTLRVPKDSR